MREYANKNGYHVLKEFVDEAETGRTTSRPAFREMISLAKHQNKPFEQILVWKYSRFARSREDSIVYKTMLKKVGVSVVSINEPFDDTPTGRLLEGIIESLDEFYSDNLGEEVTRGLRESASRGYYLSSRPPYGYRKIRVNDGLKERTKLELDPNQAEIITRIFEEVLDGKGPIDIGRELNKAGIASPKEKGWNKTGLYGILTNEIYTGVFVWGKNSKRGLEPVRTENVCTPIISKEIFMRVQYIMKERAPAIQHPKRVSSQFLLSGLAKCGYCGKALIGRHAKSGRFAYYICGTLDHKGAGSCVAKYLNAPQFESKVIRQLRERILTRDNLTNMVKLVNEEIDSTMKSSQTEIDLITDQVKDIAQRLDRLYDAIETGKVGLDDVAARIRELRNRQEQLQARRITIENEISDRKVNLADAKLICNSVDELQSLLEEGSITERRAFIRSFIQEIKVIGNEAIILYTLPGLSDNISLIGEGVLPTIRYGGLSCPIHRTKTFELTFSLAR